MEVKINKEIRNYTESMFFGLSLRQFIFSLTACGVAIVLYFALKPVFRLETLSWVCIFGAAPFAAMGFITYHGMTAEHFAKVWLRSEFIEPKEIKFEANAFPTAITQNVEYLLNSVQARTKLSNSEFVVMLNQAASDREQLAELLNISGEQLSYITNADSGCGLIKYGSALVPFVNRFPHNTKLYHLMTTRPGEGKFGDKSNG